MQSENESFQIVKLPELPRPKRLACNYDSAATALGVCKRTLRREINAGHIILLDGYCLVAGEELERWVEWREEMARERLRKGLEPRRRARRIHGPSWEAAVI